MNNGIVCCMIIVVVSLYVFWWVHLKQERPYNHENTDTRLLIEVKHDLVEVVLRWGTTLEFSMLFLKFPFAFFTSILTRRFFIHFITDIIRFKWHGSVRINMLSIYMFSYVSTDRYFFHFERGQLQTHQIRKSGKHRNWHYYYWKQKWSTEISENEQVRR